MYPLFRLDKTSLHQRLEKVSPFIDSCLNLHLSATATATTAFLRIPNYQNNLSTTASFFSDWRKSREWSQNVIRMASWWFDWVPLFCCGKHKLSAILIANVASLDHLVMLKFWFKTFFKFFVSSISFYYLWFRSRLLIGSRWLDSYYGPSRHELGTINE